MSTSAFGLFDNGIRELDGLPQSRPAWEDTPANFPITAIPWDKRFEQTRTDNGVNVSAWTNLGATGGNLAQSTTANRPTVGSLAKAQKTIAFDGGTNSQNLDSSGAGDTTTSYLDPTQFVTFTVVRADQFRTDGDAPEKTKDVFWNDGADVLGLGARHDTAGSQDRFCFWSKNGSGTVFSAQIGPITASQWNVLTVRRERDTKTYLRVNNVMSTEVDTGAYTDPAPAGTLYVGYNPLAGVTTYLLGAMSAFLTKKSGGWAESRLRDVARYLMSTYGAGPNETWGTATLAMQSFAEAATGTETFSAASGSLALQPYSESATGTETFSAAAGTLAMRSYADAATGAETFSGSAAANMQSYAEAATGTETFSAAAGSLTLQSFSEAATAAEIFSGAATLTAQAYTEAAAGSEIFASVSASLALQPFAEAATGAETFSAASGTLAMQPYSEAASGAETFSGAATLTEASFATAATGAETFSGSSSLALRPYAVAASGAETFTASAALALQPFAPAAVGAETFSAATGSLALQPFSIAATAQEIFAATASLSLQSFALLAAGQETFSGAAALSLSPFGSSAIGFATDVLTGTGSLALNSLNSVAAAAQVFSGSSTLVFAPLSSAANAEEIFSGTASLFVAPYVHTGAAEVFWDWQLQPPPHDLSAFVTATQRPVRGLVAVGDIAQPIPTAGAVLRFTF